MKIFIEHEEEQKPLQIPFSVNEISWSQFIDFQKAEEAWNRASVDENGVNEELIEELLTECVAAIIADDFSFIPFSIPGDDIKGHFENAFQLKIGDEISTIRLYTHLVVLINSFEAEELPATFNLEIDGENYYIEPEKAARLFSQKAYTTGEVIELKEFERNVSNAIDKKGDPNGNLAFTLGLTQAAILLRKDGEKLPMKASQRQTFIKERVNLFQSLSMDKILNIRFFLLNILKESLKTHFINISLKEKSPISTERTKTVVLGPKPYSGRKLKRKNGGN